jgi:hypothetical protein
MVALHRQNRTGEQSSSAASTLLMTLKEVAVAHTSIMNTKIGMI